MSGLLAELPPPPFFSLSWPVLDSRKRGSFEFQGLLRRLIKAQLPAFRPNKCDS